MGPFWFSQKLGLFWLWKKALLTSTGVISCAQKGHQSGHLKPPISTSKWNSVAIRIEPIDVHVPAFACMKLVRSHQMPQPAELYHKVNELSWRGWTLCPMPLKLEFTNEFLMFEVLPNRMNQMSKKVINSIVLKQIHSFCKDKTFLVNLITCVIRKAF